MTIIQSNENNDSEEYKYGNIENIIINIDTVTMALAKCLKQIIFGGRVDKMRIIHLIPICNRYQKKCGPLHKCQIIQYR